MYCIENNLFVVGLDLHPPDVLWWECGGRQRSFCRHHWRDKKFWTPCIRWPNPHEQRRGGSASLLLLSFATGNVMDRHRSSRSGAEYPCWCRSDSDSGSGLASKRCRSTCRSYFNFTRLGKIKKNFHSNVSFSSVSSVSSVSLLYGNTY